MKKFRNNLVLMDVGNTAVTCGSYYGARLLKCSSVKYDDIPKYLKKSLKKGPNIENNVVISSVVPKISLKIKHLAKKLGYKNVLFAGTDLKIKVKHAYLPKKSLGTDRLVNAFGGPRIYGSPLLIIDFGTAITLDYLASDNSFKGGMIIPGPELSFQALINRASQISKKLKLPLSSKAFLGNSTYDCICSGTLEGYGAMVEELILRFRDNYGYKLRTLATGGFATHLKPYTRGIDIIDPKLNLKSLLLLYKQHIQQL